MAASRRGQSEARERISLEADVDQARAQLEERVAKGRELSARFDRCRDGESLKIVSNDFWAWDSYNKSLLDLLFSGPIEDEYRWWLPIASSESTVSESIVNRIDDLSRANRNLESIMERLPLWVERKPLHQNSAASSSQGLGMGDRVFIVHGRDNETKLEVARFLERGGINPLILHEQPSQGMTLVEKLEHYSSQVGFAIVILSPDDIGGLSTEPTRLTKRSRQNVVFEMGYFIGLLKRRRVCALLAGELERPSDIDGVVYIPLEGNWKTDLAGELRAVGFAVDLNRT